MRRRILAIPAVDDLDTLGRLMAHLGHYFSHVKPERISVLVDDGILDKARAWLDAPSLPQGFDDAVLDRIEAIRRRFRLHGSDVDLDGLSRGSDIVLDWDIEATAAEPWAAIRAARHPDLTLYTIDWRHVRLGAASIAKAAETLKVGLGPKRVQEPEFGGLFERVGSARRAYLLGTGPSARAALEHDMSDGVRIACNTFILDDELMAHVQPQLLAFADPIFHFGPSTYAQRFQRALAERARAYDFAIVTTQRYQPLLQAHLPELADRIYGVRQGPATWWDNFDLRAHPAVRAYPNVLTMLMLPLAASVARWIGLIGFDGRAPDEDYFWKHGSTLQFDQELQEIRIVHPGFFEIDYADYYDTHIATMERLFSQLEERGTQVRSLGASFIPALRRRSAPPAVSGTASLVSVTPDWIGDFGHFGAFERSVHRAAKAAGVAHVALASAGLQPTADWQLPVFSEATFFSSAANRHAPVGERFEGELRAALAGLELDPDSTVFMYTADAWHLVALLEVAAERPDLRFVANLMRAHGWIQDALDARDPWATEMVELLRSSLAAASGTNLTVAVDSEALAGDIESLTSHVLPVWPMIALANAQPSSGRRGARDGTHVITPSAKGMSDLMALAERVEERLACGELKLTARWPVNAEPDLVRAAERLESMGVGFVRGILTDQDFADLLGSADVAFIPYPMRPFRTRTSGVIVDTLLAGTPVVAVRGTWGGDLVERYRVGVTYRASDPAEMEDAIQRVIANLDDYRGRVAEAHESLLREHSPEHLVGFLRHAESQSRTPEAEAVARAREQAGQMRRLHRWYLASYDSTRLAAAAGQDDMHRLVEYWRQEAHRLKREQRPSASPKRISRREGVSRVLRGKLGPVLVAGAGLAVLAGWFATTGADAAAFVSLGTAWLASSVASVVLATRLMRRS